MGSKSTRRRPGVKGDTHRRAFACSPCGAGFGACTPWGRRDACTTIGTEAGEQAVCGATCEPPDTHRRSESATTPEVRGAPDRAGATAPRHEREKLLTRPCGSLARLPLLLFLAVN